MLDAGLELLKEFAAQYSPEDIDRVAQRMVKVKEAPEAGPISLVRAMGDPEIRQGLGAVLHFSADQIVETVGLEGRIKGDELTSEISSHGCHFIKFDGCVFSPKFRESGFKVGDFGNAGPVAIGRSAMVLEDFEYLIDFGIASKNRPSLIELGKDAANGPGVDAKGVLSLPEQNFGRAVPQCFDFMSQCPDRD